MADQRLNKLAKLLVNYSTQVKPGDFVYVSCEEVATPWMVEVVKEAVKAGAHVETVLSSQEVSEIKLKYSSEEQLLQESLLFKTMLGNADVWLSAWGNRNTKTNSRINADKLKISSKGAASWRKIYSERMGNGTLRWCGTQFPTYADAQEASMSFSDYEDFVYGAGLLHAEDPASEWKKISEEQERWVKYLDTKKGLHFISKRNRYKSKYSRQKVDKLRW